MQLVQFIRFPEIPDEYIEEYRLYKFNTNNTRMLVVAVLLTVEQLLLGIIVADKGSLLQKIYFTSSAIMLIFVITGFYFNKRKPLRISFGLGIFEASFAVVGMSVAILRFFVIRIMIFSIPTVYIAVLYGIAVVVVFNKRQGPIFYVVVTLVTLIFLPRFHPEIMISNYSSDIITNGFISAVILMLNTRRFISAFLDKKKIETANNELREQSFRDSLTGLFNRRKLDDMFYDVCLKSERYNGDFSLMMIDIDDFKGINDNYGHQIGDEVLVEFSGILEKNIREVDLCGRWGGEEFLIICRETEIGAAQQLAERLRMIVEEHVFCGRLEITASFGVAAWSELRDRKGLLNAADSRMYAAKSAGKNRVVAEDRKK